MTLCTLHPSLTALVSNLEAWEQLRFGIGEGSGVISTAGSTSSSQQAALLLNWEDFIKEVSLKEQSKEDQNREVLRIDALNLLREQDRLLYSDHFVPSAYQAALERAVDSVAGSGAKIENIRPKTVSEILGFWDSLGKDLGHARRAHDLHQRVESQLLDWTSNFYARLRGKRVLVLSSLSPVVAASSWIGDIIRRIGALAPELEAESDQIVLDWDFVKKFDPHVIILAPLGKTLAQSKKLFFELEGLPSKEQEALQSTAAAKRGEIYFAEGTNNFYSMDYRILKTLGVIVSASAGFESGYITERDSFFKLRYLEMQRHKI